MTRQIENSDAPVLLHPFQTTANTSKMQVIHAKLKLVSNAHAQLPVKCYDTPALWHPFTYVSQQNNLKMQQHENYNPSSAIGQKNAYLLQAYNSVTAPFCACCCTIAM